MFWKFVTSPQRCEEKLFVFTAPFYYSVVCWVDWTTELFGFVWSDSIYTYFCRGWVPKMSTFLTGWSIFQHFSLNMKVSYELWGLTAVKMWVTTLCGLVRRRQRFWRWRSYIPPKRWYLPMGYYPEDQHRSKSHRLRILNRGFESRSRSSVAFATNTWNKSAVFVRPSVCQHVTTREPLNGISRNFVLWRLTKICLCFPVLVDIGQQ
jgi:hypothetical protein